MTDHAELRRLAKAATPGARYQGTDERVIVAGNGTIICTVSGAISGPSVMADAEFLCATDPNTILGLISDLEEARNGMEYQSIMRLKNEMVRLKAENEVLRKDAARYRWLRERDLETIRQGGVFAGMTPENIVLNQEDLDAAIDAALEGATQ
ncbi:hypothetical protein IPC203_08430 [Pseudomonas aeruginosa]|uniref:hypothetical protein n=1 Tax=Pseudomonas aeruginosa TaxID=287 RepID=UPI000F52F2E8|nr:hypothetical protein [Pseudomonas aeruginosa]RQG62788.1 hypothetical protein IPC203_08430 [Pseudomonas aeruginosa]